MFLIDMNIIELNIAENSGKTLLYYKMKLSVCLYVLYLEKYCTYNRVKPNIAMTIEIDKRNFISNIGLTHFYSLMY